MPVSGAVERRRRKAALQNELRDQRHRARVNREEAMRDRRANYQTNRLNAADAIGSQYGPASRSAYLQGRVRGGPAGDAAAAATAQGMRTAQYVGQQNAFMDDAANRYGVTRTADANYLTGEGNRMAGYGAMHDPFERTKQAQVAADAQRYVADNQLAGVYDANDASRFGAAVGGRTAQYQTDVSAGVARDQIASQERLASMPVARDIVPLGDGTAYYDPALGRAVGEDEQAAQAQQRQQQVQFQQEVQSLVAAHPEAAAKVEAENPEATDEEKVELLRREIEFMGGDKNVYNARFWSNPRNAVMGHPLGLAARWSGLF